MSAGGRQLVEAARGRHVQLSPPEARRDAGELFCIQHLIGRGRNRDTAWYAMLERDWQRVKRNMRRRLCEEAESRPSLKQLNEDPHRGERRP